MINNTSILIEESRDLLYLAVILRQSKYVVGKVNLFDCVTKEIDNLGVVLRSHHFPEKQINKAIYLICSALDEASNVNNASIIKHKSLINHYYGEEFSGENFFKILDKLYDNELKNLSLIKLAYLLLCFGFLGKYGLNPNNTSELDKKKDKAALMIRKHGNICSLFIRDQEVNTPIFKLTRLKIILLFSGVLTFSYIYYLYSLNEKTDQFYNLILNIF